MHRINLFSAMAEKIVSEQQFFKITCKDGETRLYKREGNRLIEDLNGRSLKNRCFTEIMKNLNHFSEKSTQRKLIQELFDALELSPGFIKDEEEFMPPQRSIPLANGEFSFENNEFKKDDNKTLRLMRLNASYVESYVNDPLPKLLIDLLKNGISNPHLIPEENESRYESFLDCLSYAFYPINHLRKFFIISGAPHSGKQRFLRYSGISLGLMLVAWIYIRSNGKVGQILKPGPTFTAYQESYG